MTARMLYVHALTPIRVGLGQGAGVLDLPVIRETVTGWPYLPGSSVKGVVRDACAAAGVTEDEIRIVFGPDTNNAALHAGGVIFSDLRLLCLPVRSYAGGFVWVTSPLALARWARDYEMTAGPEAAPRLDLGEIDACSIILPSQEARIEVTARNAVWLEDLTLTPTVAAAVQPIAHKIATSCFPDAAWQSFFTTHVGVVANTTFGYLARTATEITARTRIDDDLAVVVGGALWYEEAAPAETIFAGPLLPTPQGIAMIKGLGGDADTLGAAIAQGIARPVQIGGNASVGRGLALARLDPPAAPAGGDN